MTQENPPNPPENKTALHFEAALEQLQLAVKKLESGELSLEQSLRQFEEGVRLTGVCQGHLSVAEQKVDLLIKGASEGQYDLQPFPSPKG